VPLDPVDLLALDDELTEEQRAVRDSVRRFAAERVAPLAPACFREGRFPRELVAELADLGLFGATLDGWGCAGMDPVSFGVAMRELEHADSGVRSFAGVQSSLFLWPVARYGTPEQQERWIPAVRAGSALGCFGLSEPDAGSDPGAMRTRAVRDGDDWRLTGTKRWITCGTLADVALVWARTGDDARSIRAFLVERGAAGFEQRSIEHKQSFRMSDTAELVLDDVRVPDSARLPGAEGLGAALAVLGQGRFGVTWGVIGAARSCLQTALEFAKNRDAFGGPLAGKQLVQKKLAEMAAKVAHMQLLATRLGALKAAGTLRPAQVSLGKMSNVESALFVARTARDVLGANGIMDDYPVMRHMNNLETIYTYEGTHDVHLLVLGKEVTGLNAFG
jgi:glutaryl-CoA dehydrogenase